MTPNDDDRRAAWGFRPECYTGEDKAGWLAGAYDCIRIIQAFTAHRIAAERRGIERAAEVADEHACQHCAHISAAIRAITTEGADK